MIPNNNTCTMLHAHSMHNRQHATLNVYTQHEHATRTRNTNTQHEHATPTRSRTHATHTLHTRNTHTHTQHTRNIHTQHPQQYVHINAQLLALHKIKRSLMQSDLLTLYKYNKGSTLFTFSSFFFSPSHASLAQGSQLKEFKVYGGLNQDCKHELLHSGMSYFCYSI
jgi:hypothetical protein